MPQPVQPAARRRKTVFFSGRVQGVGFRYTAKTVATGFEITGTIRNLPDGRVELVAEGRTSDPWTRTTGPIVRMRPRTHAGEGPQ